ncbi:MAG: porphobilinogen synthase [Proteobacteria bacterium]|nr:porphobilinogen synthase [Pseudomonadota bacterium]
MFPDVRLRRLRRTETLRRMVRETTLTPNDLIQPLFIVEGAGVKEPIGSLPGQFHWSVDAVTDEAADLFQLGVPAVILFGVPDEKDPLGKQAYDPNGVIQRAIKAIKDKTPDLVVIGDVCLCEYTDHGHCGVIKDHRVDNDATLDLLVEMSLAQVRAGVDVVAPSDMMDGRVGAIREALDENGFTETVIMSYAAKYASAFYGPFREAAGSAPAFGDRKSYQMDPANVREALRECDLDVAEGADIIMVKPAMAFMDVIRAVAETFDLPLAAYNVSGEYAMVKAAGERGWIDEEKIALEILTGIKRAGADMILTYFAKDIARKLAG